MRMFSKKLIMMGALLIMPILAMLGAKNVAATSLDYDMYLMDKEYRMQVNAYSDVLFYEPCNTEGERLDGDIQISGKTAEEKVWSGLASFLSDAQAAGVMGNIAEEDPGYNPARREVGQSGNLYNKNVQMGLGLIQWSFGWRVNLLNYIKKQDASLVKYIEDDSNAQLSGDEFIAKVGEEAADRIFQLEIQFLKNEIDKSYTTYYEKTDPKEAAVWFRANVERAGVYSDSHRMEAAQAAYDKFAGKTTSSSDSEGGGSSGTAPSCNSCAQGSKNINGAAVCLAWPLGTDSKVYTWKGGKYGSANLKHEGGEPTTAFKDAMDAVFTNSERKQMSLCPRLGASCDVFSATAVRYSGYDPKFPRGVGKDKDEQLGYARSHKDLWEVIPWDGDKSKLQAGDVINTYGNGGAHSYIIVQDEKGEFYIAEASICGSFGHITKYHKPSRPERYIIRPTGANNSTVGVDVKNGVKSSSTTGTLTTTVGSGNGDINASAFELAWPVDTPESTSKSKAYPNFVEFFNTLPGHKNTGGQTWRDGKSCMVFVNTVLQRAGFKMDKKGAAVTSRLIKSDEWDEINNEDGHLTYGDLQPGDVLSYYASGSASDGGGGVGSYYKGYGLKHEAIFGKDANGDLRIIEAHFERQWGHVKKKKLNSKAKLTSSWAKYVRVFRWKKQGNGTGCDLCEDPSGIGLKDGGMTLEEAKEFMKQYREEAKKKKTGSYYFQNALVHDSGCKDGALNNCSAFSEWFVNRYTSAGPDITAYQGSQTVKKLLSLNKGFTDGKKTPAVYSVFSTGPFDGSADGWYNHTGVVLGIDQANNKLIVGEASCSNGWTDRYPNANEYPLDKWTNGASKYAPTYAYTDGILTNTVGK